MVRNADVEEVADRLNEALRHISGQEPHERALIQPLKQAGQIVIFGPKDRREMVKKLIAELITEIDIPPGLFEPRAFKLKDADADKVKEKLEGLYEQETGYSTSSGSHPRGSPTV